jgi:cytochrome c5
LYRLFREHPDVPVVSTTTTVVKASRKTTANGATTASSGPAIVTREGPHSGKKYYDLICSGCHDAGAMGAPELGNREQWEAILEQPRELTRDHVMNGYNAMPERGLCYTCSEAGLMEIVDYMFEQVTQQH